MALIKSFSSLKSTFFSKILMYMLILYKHKYIDWKKAKKVVLPNLKPSVKTISLRLPKSMLEEIKLLANKRDVPYQSLMKIFLSERIEKELNA